MAILVGKLRVAERGAPLSPHATPEAGVHAVEVPATVITLLLESIFLIL